MCTKDSIEEKDSKEEKLVKISHQLATCCQGKPDIYAPV